MERTEEPGFKNTPTHRDPRHRRDNSFHMLRASNHFRMSLSEPLTGVCGVYCSDLKQDYEMSGSLAADSLPLTCF